MYVPYRKSVKHRSIEGIQDTNHPSIGGNENQFPIVTEFDSSPVTGTTKPHLKGSKGTLFKERFKELLKQYDTGKKSRAMHTSILKTDTNKLISSLPFQKHEDRTI